MDDWAWVGTVATVAVATVGLFFSWLTGKQSRDHAETLEKIRLQQAERAAHDARIHGRRADAYLEALRLSESTGLWAQAVRPMLDSVPPRTPPPLPDLNRQAATRAQLLAFGSREVQDLWGAWVLTVRVILMADAEIDYITSDDAPLDETQSRTGIWGRLEQEMRPAEREAREALARRINLELTEPAH